MGYLLKEALKALCGVNQWSYAVFWKFGCQNPKLLIWEECYHRTLSFSNAPQNSTAGCQGINLQKSEVYQNAAQVEELMVDRVRLLMEKMMMSNHVYIVGQGLVGRAAFTANHLWVVSGNCNEKAHPPEVVNEIHLQFSAGMQTVVVIPVIPHGVVQFGSPLAVVENVGFVHDVRSLILQVGCTPNGFVSENYGTKDGTGMFGPPIANVMSIPLSLLGNPTGMNVSPVFSGNFNRQQSSSQALRLFDHSSNSLITQCEDNLQDIVSTFPMPNQTQDSSRSYEDNCEAKNNPTINSRVPPNCLLENKIIHGTVTPLKPTSFVNHPTCSNNLGSSTNVAQPQASCRGSTLLTQPIASHGVSNHEISTGSINMSTSTFNTSEVLHAIGTSLPGNTDFTVGIDAPNSQSAQKSTCANLVVHDADASVKELLGLLNTVNQLSGSSISAGFSTQENYASSRHTARHIPEKLQNNDVHEILKMPSKKVDNPHGFCNKKQRPSLKDLMSEDIFYRSAAGDDLFDVLGVDFKNKLLNGNDSKLISRFDAEIKDPKDLPRSMDSQNLSSLACSDYQGLSESGVFSSSGSDHLLDAVITGVSYASKQNSDDNISCRTNISKISCSSVPSTPHSNPPVSVMVNLSDGTNGQFRGISKPMMRVGEPVSSIRSSCGKNGGNGSITSSAYGSQISSWVEQGPSASVSTANSKKPDEVGKSNRKRLKPGENPRPRPKDRQMIQDRVKELREIVPNGAKCSIDALLERTIKHMLFLQSVTKHAEKLTQTVDSKIANKEGGTLLNEHFEGGATWAFELGSQSMVCPIVVEDLNPPRQLLIEMLCEERGPFLEIADIIRGLGLTILKGVMETRSDKIWARFAVEANRDVTRMEVFISLVHLLEQTLKGSTTNNGQSDENVGYYPAALLTGQQPVG